MIRVKKSQDSSHLNLRYQTGLSVLVRPPPPQKRRAVPKPAASEVVVLDFGHKNRLERVPLANPVTKLRHDPAYGP